MSRVMVDGDIWTVVATDPLSSSLVDHTGTPRIATTDPARRIISISIGIPADMLEKVVLHEIAHAVIHSHKEMDSFAWAVYPEMRTAFEESLAQFIERRAVESVALSSQLLGKPLCIGKFCVAAF